MREKYKSWFGMNLYRVLSYFFAFITLILPVLGYLEYIHLSGFPDGNITEYGRAGKILYKILIWPGFVLGLCFIYLGWTASRQRINRKLTIAVSILIFYVVTAVVADRLLFSYFDHGQGG